ncbi:MAG: Ni/Fe-hydrogenase cytochrome b subunit [Deltaproteobacteria bacterium]|nr:Ni/Fe-hydrogenase cytochrome b subunit [Deltaproteobacteria bacterium]
MKGKAFFAPTFGALVVWLFALAGAAAIVYRFWAGIGAVTNLSDGYPWGLWVAVDILAGVALAAGGFVVAGVAHLFGGKQFEALARPAVLAALLGYLMFVLGLIVDMGRPWNMIYLYFGNHGSPLYEIGWCASLYTLVLCMELLPAVLEKYSMKRAHALWLMSSPWLVVVLLSTFAYAMTYSLAWAMIVAAVLSAWELSMAFGKSRRTVQIPILLIGAGVILSFLHQSSLGVLFLMASHKLSPLWHSPLLPILFLVSAICAGIGMMTLEALGSEKFMGRRIPLAPLAAFARQMPVILAFYLILKIADILARDALHLVFAGGAAAVMWWAEMGLGLALPLALYLKPGFVDNRRGLFAASFLVVAGVVINRINVAMIGVEVERWGPYHPSFTELLITFGIIAMGLLAYDFLSDELPIHEGA